MSRRRRERGSATAEIAVALPALVVLVLAGMTAVAVVGAQLRCIDAAREAARAAARGEPPAEVRRLAAAAAPAGARIAVSNQGGDVSVTVSAWPAGMTHRLPVIEVSGRAVGRREPGLIAGPADP